MTESQKATAPLMVAGNWKMNTTVDEGVALARAVCASVAATDRVEIAVLPPFTHLWTIHSVLVGTGVRLGAQDVYWKDAGAFTGEISPAMLAGWCDLTLVGHSERRHIFGERDDEVGKKFVAALAHGLQVILAVGETSDERDDGRTFDVVDRQLDAVFAELAGPPAMDAWVIAYEPVWAIGTGRTATPEQAQEVVAHIKHHVRARFLDGSPRVPLRRQRHAGERRLTVRRTGYRRCAGGWGELACRGIRRHRRRCRGSRPRS